MILLIGASGYIGSAFLAELISSETPFHVVDHFHAAQFLLSTSMDIKLVINCAAFIPKESVALCDKHQRETIEGNLLFPMRIANICAQRGMWFAQISTGCLWSDGKEHIEEDEPQRAFSGHCGFYVGTKVLAEQEISKKYHHYIWRVRLPFDRFDYHRNYLSKLANFSEVFDHTNSISHREDFAKTCLGLWKKKAPPGTYNVVNHGAASARDIVNLLLEHGIRKTVPEFIPGPLGGALLSTGELNSVYPDNPMRDVNEALMEAITNWKKSNV